MTRDVFTISISISALYRGVSWLGILGHRYRWRKVGKVPLESVLRTDWNVVSRCQEQDGRAELAGAGAGR